MGLFKRRDKATADIRFIDHNNDSRQHNQWTTDETIEGIASFQISPSMDCTRVVVALKGVITVSTRESPSTSLQPNWRTKKIKFLSVGKELPPKSLCRSGAGVVQAPFLFDLQECSGYSELEFGLPPSVDSRDDSGDRKAMYKQDTSAAYDITYTVTASAFSKDGQIVSEARRISPLPLGPSEPPAYSSLEEAGEYVTASADIPRSGMARKNRRINRIELAAHAPAPLVLQPGPGDTPPTSSIDLVLKLSSSDPLASQRLPQQVQVRTSLIEKIRLSPDGVASRPPPDEDLVSQTRSRKRSAQHCTLAVSRWATVQPENHCNGFAIARLSLLYRHPTAEKLAPTFSTAILCRSYEIELKVSFPDGLLPAVKVMLPVEVYYESTGGLPKRKARVMSCVDEITGQIAC